MSTVEVKKLLAYRTPTSGKPLGHIVLTRDEAQAVVDEHNELTLQVEGLTTQLADSELELEEKS